MCSFETKLPKDFLHDLKPALYKGNIDDIITLLFLIKNWEKHLSFKNSYINLSLEEENDGRLLF